MSWDRVLKQTLVPNMHYRHGEFAPFDMATVFGDESERTRLMGMVTSLSADMAELDARASQRHWDAMAAL